MRRLRSRWHRFKYRNRDATWFAIHTYGCHACEATDG